jgi:hypothetical protein
MDDLYTLSEAAAFCGVTAVTLRKYCLAGRYGRKLGNQWVLTKAEIDAINALPVSAHKAGRRPKAKKS